jgi:hypothetical protein
VRGELCAALLAAGAVGLVGCGEHEPGPQSQRSAAPVPEPLPHPGHFVARLDVRSFQRGSVHAHSTVSDGDAPIELVVKIYSRLGYQFAAITDHNHYFDPSRFHYAERADFVLLPGEEISMAGGPGGQTLVHVNALCTEHGIGDHQVADVASSLQWAIDQVRAQGGAAVINHPNWRWTIEAKDIAATHGAAMLEIFSGHTSTHNDGDGAHSSSEDKWQQLLLGGTTLAPAAVDDAHTYLAGPSTQAGEPGGYPGRGWVGVFGAETSRAAICHGLAEGRLYASAGPVLRRLAVQGDTFTLWPEDPTVLVEFIGSTGKAELATFPERDPDDPEGAWRVSYRLTGSERFVRARITQADGNQAWTAAYQVVR